MSDETRVFQKDLFLFEVATGRYIRLFDGFKMGRNDCHWNAPKDPSVSRQHALIHISGTQIEIEDLKSTNRTRLNGKELEPGTLYSLSPGDRIEVGNHKFEVRNEEKQKPSASEVSPTQRPIIQNAAPYKSFRMSDPPPPEPPIPESPIDLDSPIDLVPMVPTAAASAAAPAPAPRIFTPPPPPGTRKKSGYKLIAEFFLVKRWTRAQWSHTFSAVSGAGVFFFGDIKTVATQTGLPHPWMEFVPYWAGLMILSFLFSSFLVDRMSSRSGPLKKFRSMIAVPSASAAFILLLWLSCRLTSYSDLAASNWLAATCARNPADSTCSDRMPASEPQ